MAQENFPESDHNPEQSVLTLSGRSAASYEQEIGILREKLSDALAGGLQHSSDCAVYNAPAYEPEPCTCGIATRTDDDIFDAVVRIREHNGWRKVLEVSEAVNLVRSLIARSALNSVRASS